MDTETIGLAGIDYAIVVMYLSGVLLIGTYFARYVKTPGDFFIAGRSLPFWAIGMSIVVSDIGVTDFIAVAGGTYKYGLAQANFDWIGSMPALLIAAFLFIPYYWRSGVYTIPEFLGRRYNTAVRMILALCWGFIMVLTLGIMLYATALLFRVVLGWNPVFSILVTTIIVGIYTISGGLTAVVMTDVLQLVIMFVGGGALTVRAVYEVGGLSSMKEQILAMGPEFANHFTLYLPHDTPTPFPWTGILLGLGIVLSVAYFSGNQAVVQRALGARSEWDAKAGVLLAGFLKLFIPLLVVIPGLAAIIIVPNLENPDDAVPSLIRILLPPGIRGIMFAGFLAALMSSVDSNLNSATTIWTQDIFGKIKAWFGRPFDERGKLIFGRILSVFLLILAASFALYLTIEIGDRFGNIYNTIQTMFSYVQGPTLAILLLGILWRRATQWGGLAGIVLGVGLCVILNSESMEGLFFSSEPFLFISWWSFVFTLAVTAAVSLVTPPEPPDKLRGLVFGEVLEDTQMQEILGRRIDGQ
ncbi:sodium/solute symporter [Candidatus Sumerlaeota bacterium]|nr:sodium/solute symporter [Candidatus Sumerlaeota bacterium]